MSERAFRQMLRLMTMIYAFEANNRWWVSCGNKVFGPFLTAAEAEKLVETYR